MKIPEQCSTCKYWKSLSGNYPDYGKACHFMHDTSRSRRIVDDVCMEYDRKSREAKQKYDIQRT